MITTALKTLSVTFGVVAIFLFVLELPPSFTTPSVQLLPLSSHLTFLCLQDITAEKNNDKKKITHCYNNDKSINVFRSRKVCVTCIL